MKRKLIEAIPFKTVQENGDCKYVALASVTNVADEEHLIIDIYKNILGVTYEAKMRLVYNKHDYEVYRTISGTWSRQKLEDDCGREIWTIEDRDADTFMSEEDEDLIWEWCGEDEIYTRRYTDWVDRLERLSDVINYNRKKKMRDNRNARLAERQANTPLLPADLKKWAADVLFKGEHYIYYRRNGRYADISCSCCGIVKKYAVKRSESFEGMFETIVKPVHNEPAVCPVCKAAGKWKAAGKTRGVYGLKRSCFVGQKYKQDGALIRYIEIEKIYTRNNVGKAEEDYIITEIARQYHETGKKKIQTDFHKYDSYIGKEFWDDCNLDTVNKIQIKTGRIYCKTWEDLKGTILQYSGAKEYADDKALNLMEYMTRYRELQQLEILSKLGLHDLVREALSCKLGFIRDMQAKNIADFLGIYKSRVKQLIDAAGNVDLLNTLQAERTSGKHWDDKSIWILRMIGNNRNGIHTAMQYQTIEKLINHLSKWSGVEIKEDMCSGARTRLSSIANTYFDYLDMRLQQGYDLNNTVFLWPRDLNLAHNQMVAEVNKAEIDSRDKSVDEKYYNISRMYRELKKVYHYENETYVIRPAKKASEITQEGRTLHHCVGSSRYLERHNNGESFILFLRYKDMPDVPYVTIEIADDKIVQWYGAYDKKPEQKTIDCLLEEYVQMIEKMRFELACDEVAEYAHMPVFAYAM